MKGFLESLYDRNHIGIEDKWRKDVLVRIGGNGGMCRMDNPLDSGREDDIESTPLEGQREQVEEHQGEEELKWGKRVYECRWGGGCAELCL